MTLNGRNHFSVSQNKTLPVRINYCNIPSNLTLLKIVIEMNMDSLMVQGAGVMYATLGSIFDQTVSKFPNKEALVDLKRGQRWTYGEW